MRLREPDYFLIAVTFLLAAGGLVILYSASSVRGSFSYGSPAYFVKRQLVYGILPGLFLMALFYRLPLKWLRRLALPMFVATLSLLAAVLLPSLGVTLKGATRWLSLGPIAFQPAEFFKFAFVIYFAAFFAKRQPKISSFTEVTFPFFVFLGIIGILLLKQPATGTFGIIVLVGLAMYFFSGARLRDFALLLVIMAAIFAVLIFTSPYRFNRLMAFWNPKADPKGAAYQINQALIAIGSGGLEGLGFGQSRQKYNFLPEVIGDSIFAIYAEETGFIGAIGLLVCFLLIFYRGIRIALRVNDMFLRLIAVGLATWIVGQAFVNIAALTGLLPLTGIPLTFISYGGSALAAEFAAMGLLFNLSRHAS
jgi:cell division protein FtsW